MILFPLPQLLPGSSHLPTHRTSSCLHDCFPKMKTETNQHKPLKTKRPKQSCFPRRSPPHSTVPHLLPNLSPLTSFLCVWWDQFNQGFLWEHGGRVIYRSTETWLVATAWKSPPQLLTAYKWVAPTPWQMVKCWVSRLVYRVKHYCLTPKGWGDVLLLALPQKQSHTKIMQNEEKSQHNIRFNIWLT